MNCRLFELIRVLQVFSSSSVRRSNWLQSATANGTGECGWRTRLENETGELRRLENGRTPVTSKMTNGSEQVNVNY